MAPSPCVRASRARPSASRRTPASASIAAASLARPGSPESSPGASPDGLIPEQGPATALRALASVDESLKTAKLDLGAVYTNEFVKKANAKYPKA